MAATIEAALSPDVAFEPLLTWCGVLPHTWAALQQRTGHFARVRDLAMCPQDAYDIASREGRPDPSQEGQKNASSMK